MVEYISSPVIQKCNISLVILLLLLLNLFIMLQLFFTVQLSQNSPDTQGKLAGDVGEQMYKIIILF